MTKFIVKTASERKFLPKHIQTYANDMGNREFDELQLKTAFSDAPEGVRLQYDRTCQPLVMYKDWIILHLHEK